MAIGAGSSASTPAGRSDRPRTGPSEHFAELARRLAEQSGVSVLVLCGPDEREPARQIVAAAGHPRVAQPGRQQLGIGLTKACVRRSALLITTDSGPRHFAAAFDTPVITLFGPTHIAWTRTYHPRAWHILHRVPCGPCQRPDLSGRSSSVHARPVARKRLPDGTARPRRDGAEASPSNRRSGGVRSWRSGW